jgi:hypothetical protein
MSLPGAIEGAKQSVELQRRPAVKLPPGPPKIVIVIPIGAKEEAQIFPMPEAGHGGCTDPQCSCFLHGKELARTTRNQGLVSFEWATNHMQLVIPLNTSVAYLAEKGKLSGVARNEMTQRALEMNPEYIFYWDDDVILPPHALYQLHLEMERNPTIGLLSGVVMTREDPTEPLLYQKQGRGAWWDFSIDPNAPPEDIHAAGGGCLLVRASALRKMTPPYWADVQGDGRDPTKPGVSLWGHDIYFITKLRAESGFRTCVKGSVLCGHWDVGRQRLYELPQDAPPRRKTPFAPNPVWTVEQSPKLTPEYLRQQLRASEGGRRLYVVPKSVQTEEELVGVLSELYERARVIEVEENWLGIGEGLKNGSFRGNGEGDAPRPRE